MMTRSFDTATVLVVATLLALAMLVMGSMLYNRGNNADQCRAQCEAHGAAMVLVNRYGCTCQTQGGAVMTLRRSD